MSEVLELYVSEEVLELDGDTFEFEAVEAQEILELGLVGPPGPQGPIGPQGPPGTGSGGDFHYVHTQLIASDTWTVVHNLGKHPGGVFVEDSSQTEWVPEIERIDDDTVELRFAFAMGGRAYLS